MKAFSLSLSLYLFIVFTLQFGDFANADGKKETRTTTSKTTAKPSTSTTTTTVKTTVDPKLRRIGQKYKNFKLLASELKTDSDIDLSAHPKFYLLPNTSECGFPANFKKSNLTQSSTSSGSGDGASSSTTTTTTEGPKRQKRLVGGNFPTLGSFPWAARIDLIEGDSGNFTLRCGASLINSRYILTSARCMTGIPATQTLKHVALGTSDRRITFQCAGANETNCVNTTTVEIDEVIIHPDFVRSSAWHDIALLRLSEEVKYSQFVRPICLPTDEKVLDYWKDNKLTAYGWGRQESDDEAEPYYYSWNLQSLNISLTTREQCNRVYRRLTGKLDKSRFCAGGEAEKGTCKADTGGAIMKKLSLPVLSPASDNATEATVTTTADAVEERFYQFGIISFGRCALEGIPNIYLNVMYYLPWILDVIEP